MASEEDEPHPKIERTTAPQSTYSGRQVGLGFAILVLGSALVFGVPAVLAVS